MSRTKIIGLVLFSALAFGFAATSADAGAVVHRSRVTVSGRPGPARGVSHRSSTTVVHPTPNRPGVGPVVTHTTRVGFGHP